LKIASFFILFSQLEFFDDCPVSFDVVFPEIFEQLFAFTDEPDERPLGGEIFLVAFEVTGEMVYPESKQGYLTFGGASIKFGFSEFPEEFFFLFSCQIHI
jgi:hypothetical protein